MKVWIPDQESPDPKWQKEDRCDEVIRKGEEAESTQEGFCYIVEGGCVPQGTEC